MKFLVWSRKQIEEAPPPRVPYAVVSMRNVGSPRVKIGEGTQCKGVLQVAFDDVDDPRIGGITNEQAREVWAFIKKVRPEIQVLVCQCGEGISRSSAVAAAAFKILFGDDSLYFTHAKFRPNLLVHSRILKAAVDDGVEF